MRDRLLGILLFLPVPVVLWLFTRMPLGAVPSLGLGAFLMLTHPAYARRFALSRAHRRCLWCGRGIPPALSRGGPDVRIEVQEPRGRTNWNACREEHGTRVRSVLLWSERHGFALRAGILGALFVLLAGVLLAERGLPDGFHPPDAVALFRTGVALAVLPLSWLGPRERSTDRRRGEGPVKTPFPVHIQALIGTAAVLWLFRGIGLLWLIQGAWHIGLRARSF